MVLLSFDEESGGQYREVDYIFFFCKKTKHSFLWLNIHIFYKRYADLIILQCFIDSQWGDHFKVFLNSFKRWFVFVFFCFFLQFYCEHPFKMKTVPSFLEMKSVL